MFNEELENKIIALGGSKFESLVRDIIEREFGEKEGFSILDELLKAKVDESILSNLHVLGYPNSWSGSLVPQIQNKIRWIKRIL